MSNKINTKRARAIDNVDEIDIIDKDGAIIYPRLREGETVVYGVRNDIVSVLKKDTYYFPLEFRMKDVVINSLARKYARAVAAYPDAAGNDERFLIGTTACTENFRNSLHCPYMDKVTRSINELKGFNKEKIVGIYILDADDTDDYHNQGFVLLSKDGVYLRNTEVSNKVNRYDYKSLRFTKDGIEHIERTSLEGLLLNYSFDENFLSFAQEFMLLRRTTLLLMRERHPFADVFMEFRRTYMEILVDVAAADGQLTVEQFIRLEYIAREFRIMPEEFEHWLKIALNGGCKYNDLQKKFREMLTSGTKTDEWYVLFQDILEMAVRDDGQLNRRKLVELLRRESAAGERFVTNYIEFIRQRRQSELYLHRAIESIGYRELADNLGGYLKKIHLLQTYNNEMSLKLLDIGVLANEK